MIESTHCPICWSRSTELIWDLPQLPQTEKYGEFAPEKCPGHDQQLLGCATCGHVFLRFQLEPRELYTWGSYKFRSAASNSARMRNHFFAGYWREVVRGRSFRHLVDAGGNDLFLVGLLEAEGCFRRTVVDPVWSQNKADMIDGVAVRGASIESFDLSAETPPVDAVVSSHTFEHLPDPRRTLEKIFRETAPDALIVLEIPDWDSLVKGLRFDCIFHQHYHYFSLRSLAAMITLAGGQILDHRYNPQGTCGGSLLVTCRRGGAEPTPADPPAMSADFLRRQIERFQTAMTVLRDQIDSAPGPVFGYGASLLLGTLCYHLRPDFGKLGVIYDDDRSKHDTGYENLPVRIVHPAIDPPPSGASFLITSLENQSAIQRRLGDFKPGRIIQFPTS